MVYVTPPALVIRMPASPVLALQPVATQAIRVSGSRGQYRGELTLKATPLQVWQFLTSYEQVVGVIPDIVDSRILRRQGPQVTLSQAFRAPYTFGQTVHLDISVLEKPHQQVELTLLRGDLMRTLRGRWTITPQQNGTVRLVYDVRVEPLLSFGQELFFTLFERNILQTLAIVRDRIERR